MADVLFLFFIVIWLMSAIFAWSFGMERERGFAGFGLGLFYGPLGVIMALLLTKVEMEPTTICPHCAEVIKCAAAVCRYCGREQPASKPASVIITEEQAKLKAIVQGRKSSENTAES